jgi:hypothetical protein
MKHRGLLAHAESPDEPELQLSETERTEAIRQYRLEMAENLSTDDLLEIVNRRFKKDRHFRAGVRQIDSRKPDNPGRLGRLTDGQVYGLVHLQRLSGLVRVAAIQKVAQHFGMNRDTVQRKYEREVRRIRNKQTSHQTDK